MQVIDQSIRDQLECKNNIHFHRNVLFLVALVRSPQNCSMYPDDPAGQVKGTRFSFIFLISLVFLSLFIDWSRLTTVLRTGLRTGLTVVFSDQITFSGNRISWPVLDAKMNDSWRLNKGGNLKQRRAGGGGGTNSTFWTKRMKLKCEKNRKFWIRWRHC